nr:ABC transporter ATP-binding protein [Roseovarius salinarum]
MEVEAQAGRWTCLLGPSGVGKSTILRLIAGLGAEFEFDGEITASDGHPLPPRVMMMAQDDLVMPWLDVIGNVTLGARLRGERPDHARAREVLRRVGLKDFERRRPETLSGGQRQRVALARTLMEDRPVVLLDEPFSALDARTRARMQDMTFDVLEGRTVLLVTHDVAEAARLGHKILLMTQAGMTAVSPPEADPPRPLDAPETLSTQGALLRQLMEAA